MADPRKLPDDRRAITRRFSIPYLRDDGVSDTLKLYITAGLYPDGTLGEIFIRADKAGSFMSGTLDMFAMVFSIGLQHGVPFNVIADKMRGSKFAPAGFMPHDDEFKSCSSPFDLIAKWLTARFGPRDESPTTNGHTKTPEAAPP